MSKKRRFSKFDKKHVFLCAQLVSQHQYLCMSQFPNYVYNGTEVSIYADGKPAWGRMGILTDSARKRNRKNVLASYNKTRINIVHQHDR
jgi:hypothetical protein